MSTSPTDCIGSLLALLALEDPAHAAELREGYMAGMAAGDRETPLATLDYVLDALNASAPSGMVLAWSTERGCFAWCED